MNAMNGMTGQLAPQLARRVGAASFGLAMLGFCWWLHASTEAVAWLVRSQRGAPLPLLAVQAFAVLLVALGVPVLVGPLAFRLVRAALSGVVRLALVLARRLRPGRASAARRPVSRGVR
jgi:hypothetical protein